MHVLVTGGAGFIGRHLTDRLKGMADDVTVVDDFSGGLRHPIGADIRCIRADLREEACLERLPRGITHVIHLAAQSSAESSMFDPVNDLSRNVSGTLELLNWCAGKDLAAFAFASTMGVYGDAETPALEDQALAPTSIYGVNKRTCEDYIRLIHDRVADSVVSLRLFNVYGPGQDLRSRNHGMVGIFLGQAIRERRVVVKGSLERTRDFVYVDDVVDALVSSVRGSGLSGCEVVNIATGVRTSVSELLHLMSLKLGYDLAITSIGPTPGDIFHSVGSSQRARAIMGWQPFVDIENGISQVIASIGECS